MQGKYPELVKFIKELQTEPIRGMIAKLVGNKENFYRFICTIRSIK